MKNCTPLWREAHFQVKMYKAPHRANFFEVQITKKCSPVWQEENFESKMLKTLHIRSTFGLRTAPPPPQQQQQQQQQQQPTTRYKQTLGPTPTTTTPTTTSTTAPTTTTLQYSYNCSSTTLHYTPLHRITLPTTTPRQLQLQRQQQLLRQLQLQQQQQHQLQLQLQLHLPLLYTGLPYTPIHYTTNTHRTRGCPEGTTPRFTRVSGASNPLVPNHPAPLEHIRILLLGVSFWVYHELSNPPAPWNIYAYFYSGFH